MVRYSFLFLIVFIVGLMSVVSGQVTTSVVPGWHTTIYTPWYMVSVFQLLWLGVVSAIYFFAERKGIILHRKVFMLHLFLSLLMFWDNTYILFEGYYVERILIVMPFLLFFLGQVIFIIAVLKAKRPANLEQGS